MTARLTVAGCVARPFSIAGLVRRSAWVLLLAGCYRYVPLEGAPAGSDVRLYLTPDGARAVEPVLGPQTRLVAGRLGAEQDGSVAVAVSSTTSSHGITTSWVGDLVTIPRDAIARAQLRVLDRRRTALVAGGVVLAAITGFAVMELGGGGQGTGGTTPTPP